MNNLRKKKSNITESFNNNKRVKPKFNRKIRKAQKMW